MTRDSEAGEQVGLEVTIVGAIGPWLAEVELEPMPREIAFARPDPGIGLPRRGSARGERRVGRNGKG